MTAVVLRPAVLKIPIQISNSPAQTLARRARLRTPARKNAPGFAFRFHPSIMRGGGAPGGAPCVQFPQRASETAESRGRGDAFRRSAQTGLAQLAQTRLRFRGDFRFRDRASGYRCERLQPAIRRISSPSPAPRPASLWQTPVVGPGGDPRPPGRVLARHDAQDAASNRCGVASVPISEGPSEDDLSLCPTSERL
jgi:hypothetical protein